MGPFRGKDKEISAVPQYVDPFPFIVSSLIKREDDYAVLSIFDSQVEHFFPVCWPMHLVVPYWSNGRP
jgi:hypothetical protein